LPDPAEQRDFEARWAPSARATSWRRRPRSPSSAQVPVQRLPPTALFWLGNAQYANRDYRGAIANFRAMLQQAPDHPRAPEAVLSIANCQIELKDTPSARRTLDDLVKAYPQSEAAQPARERSRACAERELSA
jgi:tol-pal system protein YbgF